MNDLGKAEVDPVAAALLVLAEEIRSERNLIESLGKKIEELECDIATAQQSIASLRNWAHAVAIKMGPL